MTLVVEICIYLEHNVLQYVHQELGPTQKLMNVILVTLVATLAIAVKIIAVLRVMAYILKKDNV